MPVTPEDLAAIPQGHRLTIARWLIERADSIRAAWWILPDSAASAVRGHLAGAAVDLADPLTDDSTIDHANDVLRSL